ncbi:hypothetical protein AC625_09180 [Peribacillus loiseleuriae]|uniref:Uncharacterized protein n=1 Tax=Peribacillus loiseleuriae TaxID=1679170 RepID=A0A0K9GSS1_9BACI|nr:hypothetical protein AC625_09180 [Peribacillus loiseleuriae]
MRGEEHNLPQGREVPFYSTSKKQTYLWNEEISLDFYVEKLTHVPEVTPYKEKSFSVSSISSCVIPIYRLVIDGAAWLKIFCRNAKSFVLR